MRNCLFLIPLFLPLLFLLATPERSPAATILYTYDLSGRLIDTDYPDSTYIRTEYDNSGNIVKILRVSPDQVLFGDVYSDGVLNLKDAILSLQAASGGTAVGIHVRGDVNGDGYINVTEAIYLMRYVSGGETP